MQPGDRNDMGSIPVAVSAFLMRGYGLEIRHQLPHIKRKFYWNTCQPFIC